MIANCLAAEKFSRFNRGDRMQKINMKLKLAKTMDLPSFRYFYAKPGPHSRPRAKNVYIPSFYDLEAPFSSFFDLKRPVLPRKAQVTFLIQPYG